ncbi:VWA domain-containing protein [Skermania piniformis]|uniref:VWA domain-containing protein n=1 Tax=Skermania pinensis TaxID=39122 RepID=UPI000AC2A035|nr:ATP-binding protein [Skermania piniformis]
MYPFSAIVGQDRLQLALILCAVHPGIGGVLVRGEKGTAKSTIVRALAALLPPVSDESGTRPARLVELPVGATEDRVVGSLDLERVLRDGAAAFRPGLLAAAHHGVLYVDEVNLLHDHLVDLLLDAAAMGRVHIERDGVSHSHPARFVLVGTMNPEEGELRPQLLDRFGLTVDVAADRAVDTRVEVIRRRLDYERDPDAFAGRYAAVDAELADRIRTARERLDAVSLDDGELRRIAALCAAFDVDGMRADLVVARTAVTHAAWRGADAVTEADVRVAAELALPHRRRRDPFDAPGLDDEQLDQALQQAADAVEPPSDRAPDPGDAGPDDSGPDDGAPPDGPGDGAVPPNGRLGAGTPGSTPQRLELSGVGDGAPGRRSLARGRHGRVVRPDDSPPQRGLHLIGTVFAAAPFQRERGRVGGPLRLAAPDLRGTHREGREANLVVFVVDTSGSMGARARLSAVTDGCVTLLRDAYQRRDTVAAIAFRGAAAEVVLPPTSSVDIAVRRLAAIPVGGKTPLAAAMYRTRELILRERARDPRRRALVVLLTDGKATGGAEPVSRARAAAALLAREGVGAVVVDCEHGLVRLGIARDLAQDLGARYLALAELTGTAVAGVLRAAA